LIGQQVKYDVSNGDINPIWSLSNTRVQQLLTYLAEKEEYKSLNAVMWVTNLSENRPSQGKNTLVNMSDIGITQDEFNALADLRQSKRCWPFSMFKMLKWMWKWRWEDEIKRAIYQFHKLYSINRHKQSVATPSLTLENCCDDNRQDIRQIIYNCNWDYQMWIIESNMSSEKMSNLAKNLVSVRRNSLEAKKKWWPGVNHTSKSEGKSKEKSWVSLKWSWDVSQFWNFSKYMK